MTGILSSSSVELLEAKEVCPVAKVMSEALKHEVARQMGVDSVVSTQGWGAVSSRDCGRMVQKAIEIAENSLRTR